MQSIWLVGWLVRFTSAYTHYYRSRLLLFIFSPPLLVFYFCFGYTFLFATSADSSLNELLSSSIALLLSGTNYNETCYIANSEHPKIIHTSKTSLTVMPLLVIIIHIQLCLVSLMKSLLSAQLPKYSLIHVRRQHVQLRISFSEIRQVIKESTRVN